MTRLWIRYDIGNGNVCQEMLKQAVRINEPLVRDSLHSRYCIDGRLLNHEARGPGGWNGWVTIPWTPLGTVPWQVTDHPY